MNASNTLEKVEEAVNVLNNLFDSKMIHPMRLFDQLKIEILFFGPILWPVSLLGGLLNLAVVLVELSNLKSVTVVPMITLAILYITVAANSLLLRDVTMGNNVSFVGICQNHESCNTQQFPLRKRPH